MQQTSSPAESSALHVVSVEQAPPGCDTGEQSDVPRFEDMGNGLAWGIDAATTLAYTSKRECWLVDPNTSEVIFRVTANDIVIH